MTIRQLSIILILLLGWGGVCGQVLISGVFDGPLTGGTPKMIEIYIYEDVSNLSIYGVESANNGNAPSGAEYTFPAVSRNAGD